MGVDDRREEDEAAVSLEPEAAPPAPPTGDVDDDGVDRRRFLGLAWKGLAVGLAVEAGWTTFDILNPKASNAFGGIVSAGKAADYKDGTVRYFQDGRFFVSASGGKVVALYQKCPHLGCRVPFCDSSGRFECPCHGSIYNARGEYIQGPAPRGMDRFLIEVHGDEILVDTAKVIEGPPRGVSSISNDARGPSCVGGAAGKTPGGQTSGALGAEDSESK
jgi:cytochrome b6-f complex iron-sulfur subunit